MPVRWPTREPEDAPSTPQQPVAEETKPMAADPAERPNLPQRRPQQNLAPQLRDDLSDDQQQLDDGEGGRSAEEIRNTMSAFQKGSLEGRQAGESLDS